MRALDTHSINPDGILSIYGHLLKSFEHDMPISLLAVRGSNTHTHQSARGRAAGGRGGGGHHVRRSDSLGAHLADFFSTGGIAERRAGGDGNSQEVHGGGGGDVGGIPGHQAGARRRCPAAGPFGGRWCSLPTTIHARSRTHTSFLPFHVQTRHCIIDHTTTTPPLPELQSYLRSLHC